MTELIFKRDKIELYNDYLVINNKIERKLYKNEIKSFSLDKNINRKNYKSATLRSRVRITKTTYITKATPIYNETKTSVYIPKIILKNGENICLNTSLDRFIYEKNIRYLCLWLESNDLNEYYKKLEFEAGREKIEFKKAKVICIIMLAWLISLPILFIKNTQLFILAFLAPAFLALGSICVELFKNKKWVYAIILMVFIMLAANEFIILPLKSII